MKRLILLLLLMSCGQSPQQLERQQRAKKIENTLVENILHAWYPRALDTVHGGFLTTFDYKWQPGANQDKMIVTQARHVWTASKAAQDYPSDPRYRRAAEHGFDFLKNKMWDHDYLGFYQYRSQDGGEPDRQNPNFKTSYGNAFGLYATSAYYELTGDPDVLEFAGQIFAWFEVYAFDKDFGGYYQNFDRQGDIATSSPNSGFSAGQSKDQNTSIHILEAFTELYKIWPDSLVRDRLLRMLVTIRDTITTDKGSLTLFLQRDWTPISHQDSSETFIRENSYRDHISPGHDVETAFLLLEASHALGLENDKRTLTIAKKMVDHAMANAWDDEFGGIYDVGYYFKGVDSLTVLSDHKSWWAQMEALNAFLMMSLLFPDEPGYYEKFAEQWQFIDRYIIDYEFGGVYSRPIDRHEEPKRALKSHAWKGAYHTCRALMNCVRMLREDELPF